MAPDLDVDPVRVRGSWFRHVPHRGRLSYRPQPPVDGRWQHGDRAEAVYFAESEDTAWAEWYRALGEPSAARAGGRVLCLFRDAAAIEGVKAVPPPRVLRNPPLVPAGTRGWPPAVRPDG